MRSDANSMVSIDFWNTLVQAESGGEVRHKVRLEALREVAAQYRDDLPETAVEEAKRKTSREFDRIWFSEQRTPTTSELVRKILNHLDIPASGNEINYLVEAFQESLWKGPPKLAPMVEEVLPELADRFPLALISDTMYSPGRVIRGYLKEKEVFDYFQSFVFSDETGFSKPHPEAYRMVLEETGCTAGTSWHVGDLLKTDIRGAKGVGMKAILFTGFSRPQDTEDRVEPDHVCGSWGEVRKLLIEQP